MAISLTFLASNAAIRLKIRSGIELSVHQTETSLERQRAIQDRRTTQLLAALADNASLGAGLGLDPVPAGILQRVQREVDRLQAALGFDLIAISDERGQVIASVPRLVGLRPDSLRPDLTNSGLKELNGTLYETMTAPISIGSHGHGRLTAGNKFRISSIARFQFAVLLQGKRVIRATLPAADTAAIERQVRPRCLQQGCEIWIAGEDYLVIPIHSAAWGGGLGNDYQLLGFQSIDRAAEGFTQGLKMALILIAGCGLLVASCMSVLASRAVSKPLNQLVARLETSEVARELQPDFPTNSPTREINQLAACFNRAARAVQHSKQLLGAAYLEFLETMAQALDARDPYTAGHSTRVSYYAAAVAAEMGLSAEEIETIRVGAQLHDIGKIGVPDAVLRKTGGLTPEEFQLIKLHPQIGKKILERVAQFDRYLPIVELHHEDFDGSGYPYGLKGEQIPLAVRIVHVADVFDALNSDRAYRKAMTTDQVVDVLLKCCNSQFDPDVVRAFLSVLQQLPHSEHSALIHALS